MIVTARMDRVSQEMLTQFRQTFFPVERNFLPAHITLFHQAPEALLTEYAAFTLPVEVTFGSVLFTGNGFSVEAQCPELAAWRHRQLQRPLVFSRQDQQLKKLHVTIQNKVPPTQAKADFEVFEQTWRPCKGSIEGVDFWSYENGPWKLLAQK